MAVEITLREEDTTMKEDIMMITTIREEDTRLMTKDLRDLKLTFPSLRGEIHTSGWIRWITTLDLMRFQGKKGCPRYASTWKGRLASGGDGSEINTRKRERDWGGRLLRWNFLYNLGHNLL